MLELTVAEGEPKPDSPEATTAPPRGKSDVKSTTATEPEVPPAKSDTETKPEAKPEPEKPRVIDTQSLETIKAIEAEHSKLPKEVILTVNLKWLWVLPRSGEVRILQADKVIDQAAGSSVSFRLAPGDYVVATANKRMPITIKESLGPSVKINI
jgi:hypothetical protein